MRSGCIYGLFVWVVCMYAVIVDRDMSFKRDGDDVGLLRSLKVMYLNFVLNK
jgi:hypothetical protein